MENRHLEALAQTESGLDKQWPVAQMDSDRPTLKAESESKTVEVDDLSSQGFRTDWPNKLVPGDVVSLKLPGLEAMAAKVTWELDNMIGCKFDVRLHPALYAQSLTSIAGMRASIVLN